MSETGDRELGSIVASRIASARDQIKRSLGQIANGNPLGAEPSLTRKIERLQAKAHFSRSSARSIADAIDTAATEIDQDIASGAPAKPMGAEAVLGSTYDFVGVSFLTQGRAAADAVGRIAHLDDPRKPKGSGFLVGPGLLLTNNHVIGDPDDVSRFVVQFDFELDDRRVERAVTEYTLDPRVFIFDPVSRLDYSLVALGPRRSGPRPVESLGHIALSDASDKHMLGEVANIVQHPLGRHKELVLRENRLVSRLDYVLHYLADTDRGSSGSPVFNNNWQVIALHHWGGPSPAVLQGMAAHADVEVNEGIRISAIVKDLSDKRAAGGPHADVIGGLLERWKRADEAGVAPGNGRGYESRPIEIIDHPPHMPTRSNRTMPRAREDFADRAGYEPGFIHGLHVPLPELADVRHTPARNLEARIGDDPFELRYHHFSIVMNADRRLAFFTACNIDGRLARHVDRETKDVNMNPTPRDLGVESMGPEASDDFRIDLRIHPEQQMGREFYEKQIVPGFPNPKARDRIARMFQKGHIIMRGDPAWGQRDMALAAEDDTFFYTNAAPQLGFFNQGSGERRPGSKGKLRWRAVESYVLRNAVTMRERVCVFAGPVFQDEAVRDGSNRIVREADPVYRGAQVPMRFWKIVVWADVGGPLRAVALLADQLPVLRKLTNGVPELLDGLAEAIDIGPERFDELVELQRVEEFLSTVEEIEALTGLKFDDQIRTGDIRSGTAGSIRVADESSLELGPRRRIGATAPRNWTRARNGEATGQAGVRPPSRANITRKAAKRSPRRSPA